MTKKSEHAQNSRKITRRSIIVVTFFKPVKGENTYYLTTASTLKYKFTQKQLGIRYWELKRVRLAVGDTFTTDKCMISRVDLLGMAHNNKPEKSL